MKGLLSKWNEDELPPLWLTSERKQFVSRLTIKQKLKNNFRH